MGVLGPILGLFWGAVWAAFLEWVPFGRCLVRRRTWITVVIGVGGDLAIALALVEYEVWQQVALVVAASSAPIILRSLLHEGAEQVSVRLPNKVIWGLEAILASVLASRRTLRAAIERARALEDSELLAALVLLQGSVSSIGARAKDARRGEYDYSLEEERIRPDR